MSLLMYVKDYVPCKLSLSPWTIGHCQMEKDGMEAPQDCYQNYLKHLAPETDEKESSNNPGLLTLNEWYQR